MIINAKSLLEAVDFVFTSDKASQTTQYLNQVFVSVKDGECQVTRYGLSFVKQSPFIECESETDFCCQVDYGAFRAVIARVAQRFDEVEILLNTSESGPTKSMDIKAGKLHTNLKVTEFSEPDPIEFNQDAEICVEVDQLLRIISMAKVAAARQDVRYQLNGILLETDERGMLRAVGTDGHRMAVSKCTYLAHEYNKHELIISNDGIRHLEALIKICDTDNILLHFNYAYLCVDMANGATLKMQIIDGKYPDWRRVVPLDRTTAIEVDRKLLLDSTVASLSLAENQKFRCGRYTVDDGMMTLNTTSSIGDFCDEWELSSFEGNEVEIGINLDYLITALGALESEEVKIHFNGSDRGFTIEETVNSTGIQVLMPVRV